MAFTPEDGSIVAGANTYVEVADAVDYAADRGVTLPTGTDGETLLVKAADWVDSFRDRFAGALVSADQEMAWPRFGAYYERFAIASDEIPEVIKRAQIEAAIAIQEDSLTLLPNGTIQPVRREKVGPLETEYDTRGFSGFSPRLSAAEGLLAPLLRGGITRTQRA